MFKDFTKGKKNLGGNIAINKKDPLLSGPFLFCIFQWVILL